MIALVFCLGALCAAVYARSLLAHRRPDRLAQDDVDADRKMKSIDGSTKGWHEPSDAITCLRSTALSTHVLQFYELGNTKTSRIVTYKDLYAEAEANALRLQATPGWKLERICLMRLDDHYNSIKWYWSILLAGGVPAVCPNIQSGEVENKLQHLKKLLSDPLYLTTQAYLNSDPCEACRLQSYSVESLEKMDLSSVQHLYTTRSSNLPQSTVAIMFTSGSSGKAKAVAISNEQISHCISGKAHALARGHETAILNWIGIDHVAGLVEAHIRGVFLGVDQIHVEAADIVTNPLLFLDMISRHKISSTFAPNFLLAQIVDGLSSGRFQLPPGEFDLLNLQTIASGGEACNLDVCRRFTELLQPYGAPANVIVPGFGMTETGAGCIYNRSCPSSDIDHSYEFATLGTCVPGVEMRITRFDDSISDMPKVIQGADEIGNLEIRGPIVFRGYLNDSSANFASFTPDGWFRTGDTGLINRQGNLVLAGRTKEIISINGVKHSAIEQERLIEDAKIPGVTPNYIACLAWRPINAPTERILVVYQHSYSVDDHHARLLARKLISRSILLHTGSRPEILPLPPGVLHKSSLGKLSRAKIQESLKEGLFANEINVDSFIIQGAATPVVPPANVTEQKILEIVTSTLQLSSTELSVESSLFDTGVTSMDLIRMRSMIRKTFHLADLSIKEMINNDTVRSMAYFILKNAHGQRSTCYEPVVQLRSGGAKSPLWLIHPGVGEVLVFVGLAQHIQDRPVLAIRARGFEEEETVFGSIDEIVTNYLSAIQERQPDGPYLLAGYSYGSMLAFEIAKRLEATGNTVAFLGTFNLPPHIKSRMRQMSQQNCLIHLAQFLQLITEEQSSAVELEAAHMSFERVMDQVLALSDLTQLQKLDLSRIALSRWAHVAFSLQNLAVNYEPTGTVQNMDIFYCDPLAFAARSKQEWLDVHLAKWQEFCHSPPRYHAVGGAHYTMLSATHVRTFYKTLARALLERGV